MLGEAGARETSRKAKLSYAGPTRRVLRLGRPSAIVVGLCIVLTAFSAFPDVQASVNEGTDPPGSISPDLISTAAGTGAGHSIEPTAAGDVLASFRPTFQRWDGTWLLESALNRSNSDWPYSIDETKDAISLTRLGAGFSQGKVPDALYEFAAFQVKETIVVYQVPGTLDLSIPLTGDYTVEVVGTTISLLDAEKSVVWKTEPFLAWDSAETPQTWDQPVTSVSYAAGQISLVLDSIMVASASYPLYIDPTWTLSASAGWGSSTFQDAVVDQGDKNIKIGWLADNFNDNINEIWTKEAGTWVFAGGVMQLMQSTTVRAGSAWTDSRFGFKIRFTQAGGTAQAYFRFQDANNHYYLDMSEVGDQLILKKRFSGVTYTIATIPKQILSSTDYTAKLRVAGTWLEVWWPQTVLVWSGVDNQGPGVPASGYIKFATNSVAKANMDDVRVWNTPSGVMTTPIRNAGAGYRPTQTKTVGTVTAYNQTHLRIRSSPDNAFYGLWTNLKADTASNVFYAVPDQDKQRYYQLRVTLTSGNEGTPALSELTTTEDNLPGPILPTSNTGFEPWYPYASGLVNVVNGNLLYSVEDISIRGRGFVLSIARSYNSLRSSEVGPLGNGWTHAWAQKLVVNGDTTVTWNDGDGSQHTFTPKGSTGGYATPRGVTSRLVKNLADGTYTLWHIDGTRHAFTSIGRLTMLSDRDGNKLTFTYDGSGRLTTVADDSGKSLTLAYDASNRITTVTDPLSRQITYGYTGSELTSVRDTLGNFENYTHASGRISSIIDPVGKRTSFTYDGSSRVTEIWLALFQGGGVVWQFKQHGIAYSTATTRTITNARGFSTTLTLNSFGNPTQAVGPSIGSGCCDNRGNSSSFLWDGELNRMKTTDGRGFVWLTDYDHRARVVSTTEPGGNVSSSVHAETSTATQYFSTVSSQTNFRGFTTTFAYDGNGHLMKTTNAKGEFSENAYDSLGFLNWSTDLRGAKTWYEYNTHRYLTKVTNALNHVTQYGYDAIGRRTTVTSPEGFVTTTEYDAEDRVTKVTDPLGNFTSFGYNARGDRTRATDLNGWATNYTINVTNHQVRIITDPLENQTTFSHDLRGNLLSVVDSNNHVTSYEFDAYDRQIGVTSPLMHATLTWYDASGNRIGRTDANGASTTYVYDKSDRLTSTKYPGGTTVNVAFNQNSNPTTEIGYGYTKTNAYDELDRVTSVTMNYGSFSKTTMHTYDANGNRLTTLDPESGTTSYAYDAANRQWKITDPENRITTYVYDEDSRVTSTAYANGVVTTNTWNATSRLMKVETRKSDSTLIERFEYTYDKAGNRRSVKLANASISSYEYDKLHRLTKTTELGGVVTTYKYDAVGNLVEEKKGSTTKTYAYDGDDRLWDITVGAAGMRYGYDGNGNRKWAYDKATAVNTSFSYDYENRMTVRGTCTYTYAPNGERMSSACSAPTYYRYDSAEGGLSDLVGEYDSAGTRQARYTHGPGIDEPVEQLRGASSYTYQRDGLGSVSKITDASQATVNAYTYGPWGDTWLSGSLANPFRYTGREADSGSSLYHYRSRVYDPEARRFMQKDPAGMCDGTNQYAYTQNNPVNKIDPSGAGCLWGYWGWRIKCTINYGEYWACMSSRAPAGFAVCLALCVVPCASGAGCFLCVAPCSFAAAIWAFFTSASCLSSPKVQKCVPRYEFTCVIGW